MKLLFEKSCDGHRLDLLPPCDVPVKSYPDELLRKKALLLPELSENEISRHYTKLAGRTFGVNDGCYPLGSCTMKYNPKVNETAAALPGFTKIHPLQPESSVQGCLHALKLAETLLCEITGMDRMTFQPAAGAHGEFTGLLLIKAYHEHRGDFGRRKIIVPDSAHGTNPASASMAGFTVVSIPSGPDGCVDLTALKEAVGADTAGLMLTNPNTVGLFDKNILEITKIVHEAGGLNYYDGANLNAVVGIVRPGDMGFDVVHLNLHKTFSTPHGGGGPGSGPVGCKSLLAEFLPGPTVEGDGPYRLETPEHSIGKVKAFYGNFLVVMRALAYILTLGREGIPDVAKYAVLHANYMKAELSRDYGMAFPGLCMHEFVMCLEELKKQTGVSALDIAKGLLDDGIHPPTMYFPLIVPEALMVEPTETESKETMDEVIRVFRKLKERAVREPEAMHELPLTAAVRRLDEVMAARHPKLKYEAETE